MSPGAGAGPQEPQRRRCPCPRAWRPARFRMCSRIIASSIGCPFESHEILGDQRSPDGAHAGTPRKRWTAWRQATNAYKGRPIAMRGHDLLPVSKRSRGLSRRPDAPGATCNVHLESSGGAACAVSESGADHPQLPETSPHQRGWRQAGEVESRPNVPSATTTGRQERAPVSRPAGSRLRPGDNT